MERPLCPLCKTKHYAREAHVFAKSVEVARVTPKVHSQPKVLEAPIGTKFDRNAYQREYMRFWRAKKAHRVEAWPK